MRGNIVLLGMTLYGFGFTHHFSIQTSCRDGVSEGQFYQVLLYELDAIRKVSICLTFVLMVF